MEKETVTVVTVSLELVSTAAEGVTRSAQRKPPVSSCGKRRRIEPRIATGTASSAANSDTELIGSIRGKCQEAFGIGCASTSPTNSITSGTTAYALDFYRSRSGGNIIRACPSSGAGNGEKDLRHRCSL